jgi:hypothetical protein
MSSKQENTLHDKTRRAEEKFDWKQGTATAAGKVCSTFQQVSRSSCSKRSRHRSRERPKHLASRQKSYRGCRPSS